MRVVRHNRQMDEVRKFYEKGLGMKVASEWNRATDDRGVILAERGIDVSQGLEDLPWGHGAITISDPEGLPIYVFQPISLR